MKVFVQHHDGASAFFALAWDRYRHLCPDAPRIHSFLSARGEKLINDHVAFRTFDLPGISRLELGAFFEGWGYRRADETLEFPEKKLLASYWLPPDESLPKIFISELILAKVSRELRAWVESFANLTSRTHAVDSAHAMLKPSWAPVRLADYRKFYVESEYASWTAAFGIQANHFTVLVNSLRTFTSLEELNPALVTAGFLLNASGGVIKGTSVDLLEQSSTMAEKVPCGFADGVTEKIPGCYYEFARRYEDPRTGRLFEGFIPKSADKIFESTSERKG